MTSIIDDRGYNQGFELVPSTVIRMQRRADYILSLMNTDLKGDLLEIGCGTGEISYWISQNCKLNVLGTDLCEPFIKQAQQQLIQPNLKFEVLDFTNPDQVKSRKFDYIVGNGILHHLYPHLKQSLSTMLDLLKPGGKIIFMEPNIYNPYCAFIFNFARAWARLEPDEMAFSRRFITKLLKESGYVDINVEYRDFLVPGVPEFMINPLIAIGDIVEKIFPLNRLSQSLYICASKKP